MAERTNVVEKMVDELSPEGVEWKMIQDVCMNITSGGTPSTARTEYYGGKIPWLRTQEVDWLDIYDTGTKITEEGLKNSSAKMIPENCVIVAMYGATAAKVAINKIPLCTNQACCNLEINEELANYRYVFYWLCNEYRNLRSLGEGSQSNINGQKVKSFIIPIPPLAIQREIVKILDIFTTQEAELEAKLEAELEARKKQYEYYRDELLTFGDDVEWTTLGEIGKWFGGGTPSKSNSEYWRGGIIPWLSPKDMKAPIIEATEDYITESAVANSATKLVPANSVAIVVRSSILDKVLPVAFVPIPITLNQDMKAVVAHADVFPKFIAHIVRSHGPQVLRTTRKTGGSVASIEVPKLMSYPIPIPPLAEQERIVAILDKFDTLVNDISIGLPAELNARRKQYEYYRDKLLTFKPVEEAYARQ
jgi:type I restriction enzyme, S subunit